MVAYTVAGKRRARKGKRADLPGLASTPKREKNGCFVDRIRQQPDDPAPRETVMSGRCRLLALPISAENLATVDSELLSDPPGVAVFLGTKDARERAALWKVFSDLDRTEEVYHRRILGVSRHAKCGKIEYFPSRFSSENAPEIDVRDDATKDRDAKSAFKHWRWLVDNLPVGDKAAIFGGMYFRFIMFRDGALTNNGRRFIVALRNLSGLAERAK